MSTPILPTLASGALFGAALRYSGVYAASIISSQMHLQDFTMLKIFLGASASSAIILTAFSRLQIANPKPRPSSTLASLPPFSGNIIGGLLVGAGMTLTGACPGTVLVQLMTGVAAARYILLGAVIGGVAFARFASLLRKSGSGSPPGSDPGKETVQEKYSLDINKLVLAYEALCVLVIALASLLGPEGETVPVHPVVGGLLIGGAQAASLVLTGNPVGVSTAYEEVGLHFWRLWNSKVSPHLDRQRKAKSTSPPSIRAITFSLGILPGSWIIARLLSIPTVGSDLPIPIVNAVLGGFVLMFGARIAGGCPSGHGISGMAQFSIASIISVASIFVGGMGVAAVI